MRIVASQEKEKNHNFQDIAATAGDHAVKKYGRFGNCQKGVHYWINPPPPQGGCVKCDLSPWFHLPCSGS